jgi:hypothetical protein
LSNQSEKNYFLIAISPTPTAPKIANTLIGEAGVDVLVGHEVGTFAVDVLETVVFTVVAVVIVVVTVVSVASAWSVA